MPAKDWAFTLQHLKSWNGRRQSSIEDQQVHEDINDYELAGLDNEMGFGYFDETKPGKPSARIILQGENPFIDNYMVSA